MRIFNYHPVSHSFLGESTADPSPFPVEGAEWLIPAFATTLEPPERVPDKVRVFVSANDDEHPEAGAWEYFDAPKPDEASPAPDVDLPRAVTIERDRRLHYGFLFEGARYQSLDSDLANITGACVAALAAIVGGAKPKDLHWHGGADSFSWIAADNTMHEMDAQTMIRFGQAMMGYKRGLILAGRKLKDMSVIPADFEDDHYWPISGEVP